MVAILCVLVGAGAQGLKWDGPGVRAGRGRRAGRQLGRPQGHARGQGVHAAVH